MLESTRLRRHDTTPSSSLYTSTGSMAPFCSLSELCGCAGAHTVLRSRAASFSRIASHMRSAPWHPSAPAPRRLYTTKRARIASARARRQAKWNRTKFKINPRREHPQPILYKPMSNSQTLHQYHCHKRWFYQHVCLIIELNISYVTGINVIATCEARNTRKFSFIS